MQGKFITKENIFIQPTKFSDMLINASGYESFYMQIIESKTEFNEEKSYELYKYRVIYRKSINYF